MRGTHRKWPRLALVAFGLHDIFLAKKHHLELKRSCLAKHERRLGSLVEMIFVSCVCRIWFANHLRGSRTPVSQFTGHRDCLADAFFVCVR
jgi:hypothetical protein